MKEKILNFFKRKNKIGESVEEIAVTLDQTEETVLESTPEVAEEPAEEKVEEKKDLKEELSILTGKSVKELEDEFVLGNIKKYLSQVGKAVIKTETFGDDLKLVFKTCNENMVGAVLISPVNLKAGEKLIRKKVKRGFPIGAIIDYPLGESAFDSRIGEAKRCNKALMDFAILTLPISLLTAENEKELKKHIKRFSKVFKKEKGVAVNLMNASVSDVKRLVKLLIKNKIDNFVFIFNDEDIEQIIEKVQQAISATAGKKISIIADVKQAQDITKILNIGVEIVFTPFADEISKEVYKRFSL